MDFLPIATFFVALISSILSGLAGGGGGFIVAPYWLIAGLTPAQGAATGAFMSLGMGGGSLFAFRGKDYLVNHRRLVIILLIVTFLMTMVGPFFLNGIHTEVYKPILAIVTLGSLPFLFYKPTFLERARGYRMAGFVALALILLASSFITSSAFSILISVILLQVFKMSVLESTVLRRLLGIIQATVIFTVLMALGNFVWMHAIAGLVGGTLGSYIGTRYAIQYGETFAKYALATGAVIGSIILFV